METKKILAGVVTIAAVGGAGYYLSHQNESVVKEDTGSAAQAPSNQTPSAAPQSKYKDGTWEADATYNSPDGEQGVHVSITLAGDKIANASFTGTPTGTPDKFNQEKFSKGFKQEVVGKPLDEVKLDVVNGSSLTPHGFMDALEKIKTEAKN